MGKNLFLCLEAQDADGTWWCLYDSGQNSTAWWKAQVADRDPGAAALCEGLTARNHDLLQTICGAGDAPPLHPHKIGSSWGAFWRGNNKRAPRYAWPSSTSAVAARYKPNGSSDMMLHSWIDLEGAAVLRHKARLLLDGQAGTGPVLEDAATAAIGLIDLIDGLEQAFALLLGSADRPALCEGFVQRHPRGMVDFFENTAYNPFQGPSAHATLQARQIHAAMRQTRPAPQQLRVLCCVDI